MRLRDLLQFETNRPAGGWRYHLVNVATVARRWMNYLTTTIHRITSGNDHPRSIHALASVATSHHALASVATNVATVARRWMNYLTTTIHLITSSNDHPRSIHALASVATSHHALASVATRTGRTAVTLLELLIVMGLLTLLASISLTAARGLMRGNKVAEASTIVQQYLQNAQVRAITNGRPVAVFLDRVSPAGDPGGNPVPANYTVNRLQLGEVFPPYMGDQLDAVGKLINYSATPAPFANAIEFVTLPGAPNDSAKVQSGFGFLQSGILNEGFIKELDLLEVEGSSAFFAIGNYKQVTDTLGGGTRIIIPFVNTMVVPHIPLTVVDQFVRFKVYRQPTKSLAGAVTLPRGACVDLAVSGVGPADSVVASPVGAPIHARPFGSIFKHGALPTTPSPSAFSRIGIVFDAQGKLSYVLHERTNPSTGDIERVIDSVASTLYLLVGRTEQVLSGYEPPTVRYDDSAYPVLLNNSYITSILQLGRDGVPPSNLMDSENVWITCNPFTGEVRSAPVGAIGEDELSSMRRNAGGDNPGLVQLLMRHARRLAAAGMRN